MNKPQNIWEEMGMNLGLMGEDMSRMFNREEY